MLHPDIEARVGAHQIFSALLIPISNHQQHEVASLTSGFLHQPRRWHSNPASASIKALLEKLRREKDGIKVEKIGSDFHDDLKERDIVEDDWKQGRVRKNSPNVYKISCIIDRTVGSTSLLDAVSIIFTSINRLFLGGIIDLFDLYNILNKFGLCLAQEPHIMKFSEEQIGQLLSAFWMQASLPDNLPSNIEAIAHSFVLTLISSGLKVKFIIKYSTCLVIFSSILFSYLLHLIFPFTLARQRDHANC